MAIVKWSARGAEVLGIKNKLHLWLYKTTIVDGNNYKRGYYEKTNTLIEAGDGSDAAAVGLGQGNGAGVV